MLTLFTLPVYFFTWLIVQNSVCHDCRQTSREVEVAAAAAQRRVLVGISQVNDPTRRFVGKQVGLSKLKMLQF